MRSTSCLRSSALEGSAAADAGGAGGAGHTPKPPKPVCMGCGDSIVYFPRRTRKSESDPLSIYSNPFKATKFNKLCRLIGISKKSITYQ